MSQVFVHGGHLVSGSRTCAAGMPLPDVVALAVMIPAVQLEEHRVDEAVAGGGEPAIAAQDHAFMYFASFYDLDGHHGEVLWTDPAARRRA